MDNELPYRELEILWRLAGCKVAAPAADADPMFQALRPRVFASILEMLMTELEQEPPEGPLSREEVVVLLCSNNHRVRLLGVRLSALGQG